MAAYGPQGLPSGLNFGGIQEQKSTSPIPTLLGRIADNTRSAAESLSLRRETLGGGQLGAVGVTAGELMGGPGGPFRFGDFMGGGNNGLIPAGTELERSVRRLMRDEARKNGTPGIMKRF